jgi:hypothetical protein
MYWSKSEFLGVIFKKRKRYVPLFLNMTPSLTLISPKGDWGVLNLPKNFYAKIVLFVGIIVFLDASLHNICSKPIIFLY